MSVYIKSIKLPGCSNELGVCVSCRRNLRCYENSAIFIGKLLRIEIGNNIMDEVKTNA